MISFTNITQLSATYFQDSSLDYIPEVIFDETNGIIKISGESYHEYAVEFFQPICDWLISYINEYPRKKITLEFRMTYFNTSTSRRFLEIFKQLEAHSQIGGNVEVNWYYESHDLDMLESGYEYGSVLSFDFNLLPY